MPTELLAKLQSLIVWDALWTTGIVLGVVLFMYTIGRYALVPLLAAISTAAVFALAGPFVNHVPFLATVPEFEQRLIAFAVLTVIGFVIFRKNRFFEPCVVPSGWELAVIALVLSGFVLAIVGSLLSPEIVSTLSTNIRIVFVDDFPRLIWFVSPFLLLSIFRGGVD